MLNLSDRSALENYYLQKKLPEYSFIADHSKDIIKDQKYFSTKIFENTWENENRFSPKYLQQYHQKNDLQKEKIGLLNEQQSEAMREKERILKDQLNSSRMMGIQRLQQRKQDRVLTMIESKQMSTRSGFKDISDFIETDTMKKQKLLRKVLNRSHNLSGRAPSIWNDMNQTCDKFVQQAINERIIQKDNEAFENIQKRIEKDEKDSQLRKKVVKLNMSQIRKTFIDTCHDNYEKEQSVLMSRNSPPNNQPVQIILPDKRTEEEKQGIIAKKQKEKQLKEFAEKEEELKYKLQNQFNYETNVYNYSHYSPSIGLESQHLQRNSPQRQSQNPDLENRQIEIYQSPSTDKVITSSIALKSSFKSCQKQISQNASFNLDNETSLVKSFENSFSKGKGNNEKRKTVDFKIQEINQTKENEDKKETLADSGIKKQLEQISRRYSSEKTNTNKLTHKMGYTQRKFNEDLKLFDTSSESINIYPHKLQPHNTCKSVLTPLDELEILHLHNNHYFVEQSVSPSIKTPIRYAYTPNKLPTFSRINQLSQPKSNFECKSPVEQLLQKEEFRGLLCNQIGKLDTILPSPFARTVVSNSNIARELSFASSMSKSRQGTNSVKQCISNEEKTISTVSQIASTTNTFQNLSTSSNFLINCKEESEKEQIKQIDQFESTSKNFKKGFPGKYLFEFRDSIQAIQIVKEKNKNENNNRNNSISSIKNSNEFALEKRRRVNSLYQAGQQSSQFQQQESQQFKIFQ